MPVDCSEIWSHCPAWASKSKTSRSWMPSPVPVRSAGAPIVPVKTVLSPTSLSVNALLDAPWAGSLFSLSSTSACAASSCAGRTQMPASRTSPTWQASGRHRPEAASKMVPLSQTSSVGMQVSEPASSAVPAPHALPPLPPATHWPLLGSSISPAPQASAAITHWPSCKVVLGPHWVSAPEPSGTQAPSASTVPAPHSDRKSTRLNSSHVRISYAVFCLKTRTPPRSPLFPYTTLFRSPPLPPATHWPLLGSSISPAPQASAAITHWPSCKVVLGPHWVSAPEPSGTQAPSASTVPAPH